MSNPFSDPGDNGRHKFRLLWIALLVSALIVAGGSAISIASARGSQTAGAPANQQGSAQAPESSIPNAAPSGPQTPGTDGKSVLFADHFPGGQPQLAWTAFPGFNGDNMTGTTDSSVPGGATGVGVLTNSTAGGFAALSYVMSKPLTDYYVETRIRVTVTTAGQGPLNGVAFGVDPFGGSFYRLAAQFDTNPKLSLAYVGQDTNNFPMVLAEWTADQIPGGVPKASGWHKMAVSVASGMADVYWDGVRLQGGPFPVDRVPSGMVGVYSTFSGGLGQAETRVADFTVWSTQSASTGNTQISFQAGPRSLAGVFDGQAVAFWGGAGATSCNNRRE